MKDRPTRCRHFRGTIHETCAAGVNLRALVGGADLGWATRLPCLATHAGPNAVSCAKYQPETPEERGAARAEMMRRLHAVGPILREIKRTHAGEDAEGCRACPLCGGRLRFRYSASNGHVWLRCETADCVAMME